MDAAVADASLTVAERRGATVLVFSGRLGVTSAGRLWNQAIAAAKRAAARPLVLDLAGLESCDTAGATLLLAAARVHGGPVSFEGAGENVTELIARLRSVEASSAACSERPPSPSAVRLGAAGIRAALDGVAFLGEALIATLRLPMNRRLLRATDLWRTADQAGVRAVPLVLLLGTLMGLILAFQSLLQLRAYGADLYVANLVGVSLTRELGPLLAAVILSGRTGSAFAAEIGTMQVNQEIDALKTLGIDPMTLLVLPRLFAAALVMPVLTVLLEIAGIVGMLFVLRGVGIPPTAVVNQLAHAMHLQDVFGGLLKAVVFGSFIAGIGCRAGLATGIGPQAVGVSATEAVVGGIVATIALDGLFAVLFYRLGA
ncbi:MAG TPA: ABC transporter permease [Acetobacteraceae bacterium]|jgi:phospholipid/cholesterol/gamma-HCH transport system permease protein|nr:ABC transporter permease [Acetobacteraceae bacterium]